MRNRRVFYLIVVLMASCTTGSEAVSTTLPIAAATSAPRITTAPTTSTAPTTTTSTIAVPPGYVLIEINGADLRMALPESWVMIDLTAEDWENLLSEGVAAIPDVAALINEEARAIIGEGGLLLAYDFDHQSGGFVSNVNVVSTERGPTDVPELIGPLLAEQLEQFGAVAPAIDEVTLPMGEAIKASYDWAPQTGLTHTTVQYYVFGVEALYIVTFSTKDLVDLEFVFETIMSTFDVAA
ncbi:MAG: hypothetical protein RI637_06360 [Acidimicrobiia bacterium]|nr:hypothetical protein [Acidimicrobiia bacterium]